MPTDHSGSPKKLFATGHFWRNAAVRPLHMSAVCQDRSFLFDHITKRYSWSIISSITALLKIAIVQKARDRLPGGARLTVTKPKG
jgi:hypothetical protein